MNNRQGKHPANGAGTSTDNPIANYGFAKHPDTGLMVADNGSTVYMEQSCLGLPPSFYDILEDNDGERYISVPQQGYWVRKWMVKDLVAEAFGIVKPGPDYIVVHKNGVTIDNRVENLEYRRRVTVHPYIAACTAPWVKQTFHNSTFTVFRDGRVKQGKGFLPIQKDFYNSDTALFIPMAWPKVAVAYKDYWKNTNYAKLTMDNVMSAAGYVDGNPKSFNTPAVLHKDHNLYNFESSNLAWCERFGSDYHDYITDVCTQLNSEARRMNPGRWTDDRDFEAGRLIYLPGFHPQQGN